MRIASGVLAILLALGCGVVSVFSWSNNGPSVEAAILFLILLISALITMFGGSPRYLIASYGILVGVMVAWCEFLFLTTSSGKSTNTVFGIDQGVLQFAVALLMPTAGLILALTIPETK